MNSDERNKWKNLATESASLKICWNMLFVENKVVGTNDTVIWRSLYDVILLFHGRKIIVQKQRQT